MRKPTSTACALLAALVFLAGCSGSADDGGGRGEGASAKVKVEVGKEFTWNDFTVSDGWKLDSAEQTINMEKVQRPFITGEVTNDSDEPRFAVFEFIFVANNTLQSTIRCTSDKIPSGKTGDLECPGFENVPTDYDLIQVQQITR